jgi:hypothetical protein
VAGIFKLIWQFGQYRSPGHQRVTNRFTLPPTT